MTDVGSAAFDLGKYRFGVSLVEVGMTSALARAGNCQLHPVGVFTTSLVALVDGSQGGFLHQLALPGLKSRRALNESLTALKILPVSVVTPLVGEQFPYKEFEANASATLFAPFPSW